MIGARHRVNPLNRTPLGQTVQRIKTLTYGGHFVVCEHETLLCQRGAVFTKNPGSKARILDSEPQYSTDY